MIIPRGIVERVVTELPTHTEYLTTVGTWTTNKEVRIVFNTYEGAATAARGLKEEPAAYAVVCGQSAAGIRQALAQPAAGILPIATPPTSGLSKKARQPKRKLVARQRARKSAIA